MGAYIPPGWPAGVHPPGNEEFESTAIGWLLDVVPPDYRLHGVLRRYPVALATMARYHSKACVEGARQGYRTARTELAGVLPPHAIDTVLAAYRKEGTRLAATARAVDLVERALRGEVFTPKMSPPPAAPGPKSAEPEDAQSRRTESGGTESTAGEKRAAGAKGTEREAAGGPKETEPEAAGAKGAEREAAGAKGPEPEAAEGKGAEQKTAGAKGTEQKTAGAKGTEQKTAGAKGAGGKAGAAERGRAGARRNSPGRGRSDLART